MPDRPSARAVGGLSLGLVLGMVGGWLAGLVRARTTPQVPAGGTPSGRR